MDYALVPELLVATGMRGADVECCKTRSTSKAAWTQATSG